MNICVWSKLLEAGLGLRGLLTSQNESWSGITTALYRSKIAESDSTPVWERTSMREPENQIALQSRPSKCSRGRAQKNSGFGTKQALDGKSSAISKQQISSDITVLIPQSCGPERKRARSQTDVEWGGRVDQPGAFDAPVRAHGLDCEPRSKNGRHSGCSKCQSLPLSKNFREFAVCQPVGFQTLNCVRIPTWTLAPSWERVADSKHGLKQPDPPPSAERIHTAITTSASGPSPCCLRDSKRSMHAIMCAARSNGNGGWSTHLGEQFGSLPLRFDNCAAFPLLLTLSSIIKTFGLRSSLPSMRVSALRALPALAVTVVLMLRDSGKDVIVMAELSLW